ncbi:MAG TPA: hypothetical protein VM098_07260 [Phycisphaerae bacterium]|nr:hypothetical protein [Phycisphaerae bacterium]
MPKSICEHDRTILRDLAGRVAEIAALPIMAERREMWKKHNSLHRVRPMILVFPEGSWRELLPGSVLQCEGEAARRIEHALRTRIYTHEHFQDDTVIEADWVIGKAVRSTGWGLEAKWRFSNDPTGARTFDPVINSPEDLKKLKFPEVRHDEAETKQRLAEMQKLFGDILQVKLKGVASVSFHLMNLYTSLRGLEQVMIDMIANPQMLHDAMAFLEEGHRRIVKQYVELNLLSLNNDGTYHSSGGNGYTDELPQKDCDERHIRPADMWASAEAQELAQVSPEMHEEFSTAYEKRLLAPFGLTGYGCCEDLTRKLDYVLRIPHIRRISISPWADVDVCAEKLGGKYIFSWKPHPAHLAGRFDADMIRRYIRHTLEVTRGCVIEMILKDTHTCDNHPERFDEWTKIARALVEQY